MCVQGNLAKLCPTVGPPGPWVTSSPSPTPALDGRTSAEGEFTAGLSGEEEELVTVASFRHRCRHDSLIFRGRPVCCSLPASASRLSGEDADRSEGVISSEDPSIFVPRGSGHAGGQRWRG